MEIITAGKSKKRVFVRKYLSFLDFIPTVSNSDCEIMMSLYGWIYVESNSHLQTNMLPLQT